MGITLILLFAAIVFFIVILDLNNLKRDIHLQNEKFYRDLEADKVVRRLQGSQW